MYIRQSKNSFIRTTEKYGYITNQLTRMDRCYNDIGADFLREINREPQKIDDIIDRLLSQYEDVDFDTLKTDFMEFAQSLADYLRRHPDIAQRALSPIANCPSPIATTRYLTTESAAKFSESASLFLSKPITAHHIEL